MFTTRSNSHTCTLFKIWGPEKEFKTWSLFWKFFPLVVIILQETEHCYTVSLGAKGVPPVAGKPVASWRRLFLTLLEETSAWFVGFSIILALVALLLILCCTQRTTPHPTGPYAQHQYLGTPAAASPYPIYQGGSYLSSPPGASSSGSRPGTITPRGTPGNVSLGTTTRQRSPDLFSVRQWLASW